MRYFYVCYKPDAYPDYPPLVVFIVQLGAWSIELRRCETTDFYWQFIVTDKNRFRH